MKKLGKLCKDSNRGRVFGSTGSIWVCFSIIVQVTNLGLQVTKHARRPEYAFKVSKTLLRTFRSHLNELIFER